MTLGNRIQEIRVTRSMSQEQFGELLGTTRQTVSKWELDQAIPDIKKIVAISRLFCIPTDDLLINVTTFEKEGLRFQCGVYRSSTAEIVETEKIAIHYYSKGKTVLGAKLYQGNGDVKELISICEKDCEKGSIYYAFAYPDEQGTWEIVGNSDDFKNMLEEPFDRKQLEKMECTESFLINHGEFELHTVREIGIRKCLEEWRKGVRTIIAPNIFQVLICTGKTEYVYSIQPDDENIYCGCSYNIPFDLGLRSYGQFFRIRNWKDNSADFCTSYYNFDYKMPEEIKGVDYVKLAQNTESSRGFRCWFVKRYKNDEIVLDGCGEDEYVFRKNDINYERFV